MRTFISIEIPEEIKASIDKVVSKMRRMLTPIKWVDKKNFHVTLKFLGTVEDSKLVTLREYAANCLKGFGAFDLSFEGMGVFPDLKHPRVIWVGTGPGRSKIQELAEKIDCGASKEGFREEENEFTPHLTIGTIKEKLDLGPLEAFIADNGKTLFGSMRVDHVSLMKSTLRHSGPIYEELEKIGL